MSEHGGVGGASLASLERLAANGGAFAASADTVPAGEPAVAPAANFRNFATAGPADSQDIYTGLGSAWDTQAMFAKLMLRMAGVHRRPDGVVANNAKPYRFPDGTDASKAAENVNRAIPAGYTYLAQFAAHDIIRNSALAASLLSSEQGNRNLRQRSLLLDALYGDGPVFSESVFELPEQGDGFRTMLRTGPIAKPETATCPYRDIPRLQQSDLSDHKRQTTRGRPDILIPDQRNDDNAIVAQVTALFHHVHNAVVTALRALPDMPTFDQEGPRGLHLFENARRVTSALYRQIIREDLLGKLVIAPIWARYVANGFTPLADVHSDGIPLEFSHAAYRLGHSMVRLSYVINNNDHAQGEGIRDVLKTRSAVRPEKFPPTVKWIADWSKFFAVDPRAAPQPSRRIGPCFNDVLLDDGVFSNPLVGPGGPDPLDAADSAKLPDRDHSGLLLRDLIRGTIGGLMTLDAVLRTVPQDVRNASALLADDAKRAQALRKWLSGSEVVFSTAELNHLSTNPPLILWLLFEAAEEASGRSLGTLGSVMVADVFVTQLAASRDAIEADPRTTALLELLFPQGPPADMPALIRFTARALGLEQAVPVFYSLS